VTGKVGFPERIRLNCAGIHEHFSRAKTPGFDCSDLFSNQTSSFFSTGGIFGVFISKFFSFSQECDVSNVQTLLAAQYQLSLPF
jgi:hypothetical protein